MCGICEICGERLPLEKHHVWGGALRNKSERYGATAMLCAEDHRIGRYAVHQSGEVARRLKAKTQLRIMREQGWTTERFIREFGKNYI